MRRTALICLTLILIAALPTAANAIDSTSPAATAATIRIQAAAKASTVVLGEKTEIRGSVSPRTPGLTLRLQNYVRSRWATEATTKVRRDGTFAFVAQPRVRGRTSWRVSTGSRSARTGTSRVLTITALGWDWVNEWRSVNSYLPNGFDDDATTANGAHYPHPVQIGTTCSSSGEAWIEYDLGRRYRRLEATVSMRDDTAMTTNATYEVIVDGRMLFSSAVRLGVASRFDLDVTNGLRLRLLVRNTGAGQRGCTSGMAVFGNLRALGLPAPGS